MYSMNNPNLEKLTLNKAFGILLTSFVAFISAFIAYWITEKMVLNYEKYFNFFDNKIGWNLWYITWITIPLILFIFLFIIFWLLGNKVDEKNTPNKVKFIVKNIFDSFLSIISAGFAMAIWQMFFYNEKWSCSLWKFNCLMTWVFISYIFLMIFVIILIIMVILVYKKPNNIKDSEKPIVEIKNLIKSKKKKKKKKHKKITN